MKITKQKRNIILLICALCIAFSVVFCVEKSTIDCVNACQDKVSASAELPASEKTGCCCRKGKDAVILPRHFSGGSRGYRGDGIRAGEENRISGMDADGSVLCFFSPGLRPAVPLL